MNRCQGDGFLSVGARTDAIKLTMTGTIDIIRNMDWKRIIIIRYDISPILSTVRQFVAILFVVTPAAI